MCQARETCYARASLRGRRIKGWGWGRRKSIRGKKGRGVGGNSFPLPPSPPLYATAMQAMCVRSGSITVSEHAYMG